MSNSIVASLNNSHKDAVFKIIFNNPKYLLSLYNALANRNISDESQLVINTLENAVFIGINNDLSFIIDDCLSLYEHQSTQNPNMPLRGLFYFADLYKKIYYSDDIFTKRQIPLLTPKFVVFYNGREDLPDCYDLRLSDAFIGKYTNHDLEVVAHIYNINEGILSEILIQERSRIMETILSQFDAEKYIEFERAHSFDDGVDSINKLNAILINEGRMDDLSKATNDTLYQKQLLKEYQLM